MTNFNSIKDELSLRQILERIFLRDWPLKLTALILALGLWVNVGGLRSPVSKRISNVQLSLSYPSDMELLNASVKEVDLIVTGDKNKIDKLRREDLVVVLDLSNFKPGDRTLTLAPENVTIELPSGVKLEEIQPSKISVRLERLEEKEVSVKPEIEGTPAKDFELYGFTVTPQKILIRGPESYIRSIDSVSTEKINIDNRSESFMAKGIGLNVINPKIRPLEPSVDVYLIIGEKRIEKIFNVPYEEHGSRRVAIVSLFAPRSLIENLKPEDLKINKSHVQTPSVVLPDYLQEKIEIKSVKLR